MVSTIVTRTFPVSDVQPATEPLPEIPYFQAVAEFLLAKKVEACSQYHGRLVSNVRSHPLIATLHAAFAEHRTVCLSPDTIWLTILQGLAHHVNSHSETLRKRFVRHEGKLKISIRRDDFVKGSPENPWPEAFSLFSESIRNHIGEVHRVIIADFSTTGAVERAASEVALLDTMQAFFSYETISLCGIPAIQLEGTAEDWRAIVRRVQVFRDWGLGWWIDALEPILNQFVAAAEDSVDRKFWESIYKWSGPTGSGSPHVSGWVLNLFPYLINPEAKFSRPYPREINIPSVCRNPWLGFAQMHCGPGRDDFPGLPSKAPFTWKYREKEFEMLFVGGLVGVRQDKENFGLRPEIGWAVLDATAAEITCPSETLLQGAVRYAAR